MFVVDFSTNKGKLPTPTAMYVRTYANYIAFLCTVYSGLP